MSADRTSSAFYKPLPAQDRESCGECTHSSCSRNILEQWKHSCRLCRMSRQRPCSRHKAVVCLRFHTIQPALRKACPASIRCEWLGTPSTRNRQCPPSKNPCLQQGRRLPQRLRLHHLLEQRLARLRLCSLAGRPRRWEKPACHVQLHSGWLNPLSSCCVAAA